MQVTIVTTRAERDEMKRTLNAYADIEDEVAKKEFLEKYPKKVWIDTEACEGWKDVSPFLVVDNRDGECFTEGRSSTLRKSA